MSGRTSDDEQHNNNNWGELLADDSPDAQVDALRQISGQESVTGLTVTIVRLSGSSNDEVRMWSAEALETAVTPTESDVPALIQMLESAADGEICYWAATMLGRLGPDAVAAVDALETCLRESMYLPARERATWALSQIGPPAAAAVPALKEAAERSAAQVKAVGVRSASRDRRNRRLESSRANVGCASAFRHAVQRRLGSLRHAPESSSNICRQGGRDGFTFRSQETPLQDASLPRVALL